MKYIKLEYLNKLIDENGGDIHTAIDKALESESEDIVDVTKCGECSCLKDGYCDALDVYNMNDTDGFCSWANMKE